MNMEKLLNPIFFRTHGFEGPIRVWDNKLPQFRICYQIEGYDSEIIVSPCPNTVPNGFNIYGEGYNEMPPNEQVDNFSEIETLEVNTTGDYEIYVNSLDNHLATFHYEKQLFDLMRIIGSGLKNNAQ